MSSGSLNCSQRHQVRVICRYHAFQHSDRCRHDVLNHWVRWGVCLCELQHSVYHGLQVGIHASSSLPQNDPQKLYACTSLGSMREVDKIKVPKRQSNSRVERALVKVSRDGEWHRILDMGFTSAEQTARGYNIPDGQWSYGYTHELNKDGDMVSILWVKWVNDDN